MNTAHGGSGAGTNAASPADRSGLSLPKAPGTSSGVAAAAGSAGSGSAVVALTFLLLLVTPRIARWLRANVDLDWSPVVLSLPERPG
jgi:hypothetical protein